MKELFRKLSNLFKFSKEDRLAYQQKTTPPQPTQEEVKEEAAEKVTTPPATPPSTPEEGVVKTEKAGHEYIETKKPGGPRGIKEAQQIATVKMPETGPITEPEKVIKGTEVKAPLEGESVAGLPLKAPPGSKPGFEKDILAKQAAREKPTRVAGGEEKAGAKGAEKLLKKYPPEEVVAAAEEEGLELDLSGEEGKKPKIAAEELYEEVEEK